MLKMVRCPMLEKRAEHLKGCGKMIYPADDVIPLASAVTSVHHVWITPGLNFSTGA